MIRERIGGAALRAYPPPVRQARGPEMLGMLLDAGEQSRLAFVPERGSLVLGGLRERRAIAARAGTRRLIADACCQAVPIFFVLWLISALNTAGHRQCELANAGLGHSAGPREPTGPRRPGLARRNRRGRRTHAHHRRPATVDHAPTPRRRQPNKRKILCGARC